MKTSSEHSHIPDLRDPRVSLANKITVLTMGVVSPARCWLRNGVGCRNGTRNNTGLHGRVRFAERTYSEANHLMELLLSSIQGWMDQHFFKARKPYPLIPSKGLRLAFSIVARDRANDVKPVSAWYQHCGPAGTAQAAPQLQRGAQVFGRRIQPAE
jgi:hypothetical protein